MQLWNLANGQYPRLRQEGDRLFSSTKSRNWLHYYRDDRPLARALPADDISANGASSRHERYDPYRSDIDGLRAIAVLSVLFYHYRLGVSGGFTGVDVFFVISGFLITSNVKSDLEAGKFSPLSFYDRRIRRIVPALLTVLMATLVGGWFFLMPGDYDSLGQSTVFSAFGLSNFWFLHNTGYFDRAAEMQPLLHTWSLGVEEQFYLVWPPLLWAGMTIVRSRRLFTGLLIGLLSAAFAYAVVAAHANPKEAFYLPLPRAWELAIGAVLAFLPAIGRPRLSAVLEMVGIGLLFWSFFGLTSKDLFPGFNAIYPCVGAALLVWPKSHWIVARSLSISPLRAIGLISYSLYLWHWPILVFYRTYDNGANPSVPQALALAILAVIFAAASYWLIEQPIRRLRPIRWKTVATGLACCAVLAGSGAVVRSASGFTSRISPKLAGLSSEKIMWRWVCPQHVTLDGQQYCAFGAPWAKAKEHAMLWGDSHSRVMAPIVDAAYRNKSVSFILNNSCPAVLGDGLSAAKSDDPDYAAHCREWHQQAYELFRHHKDVDLVMFATSWYYLSRRIYRDGDRRAPIDGEKAMITGIKKLISDLSDEDRKFIVVSDWPLLPFDPIGCETAGQSGLLRASCAGFERQTKLYDANQTQLRDDFAAIGREHPNVKVLFPEKALCDQTKCSLRYDGEYLYLDDNHLRVNLPDPVRVSFAHAIGLPVRWGDETSSK